jgi:hypothetical protein
MAVQQMRQVKLHAICTIGWFLWYSIAMQVILGFYSSHHPFLDWAVSAFLPENPAIYYLVLYSSDIALVLLMALPFSMVLQHFLPSNPWRYLLTAALVVFIYEYRNVWSDIDTLVHFFTTPSAYIGILITLGLLPLAHTVAVRLGSRYAT